MRMKKKSMILSSFLLLMNSLIIGFVYLTLIKFVRAFFDSSEKISLTSKYLQNTELQNFIIYLNKDLVTNLTFLIICLVILMIVIEYISNIYILKLQKYFSISIRSQYIAKVLNKKNSYFKDQVLGDLNYMSSSIINRLSNFIVQFFSILGSIFKLVMVFTLMLLKSASLTIVFITFAGYLLFTFKYFSKKIEGISSQLNTISSTNQGLFLEFLRIIKLLKRDNHQTTLYTKKIISMNIERENLLIKFRKLNIYFRGTIFLSSIIFLIIILKNIDFFLDINIKIDESWLISYFTLVAGSIFFLVKVVDIRFLITSLIPQVELLRSFIYNKKDVEKNFQNLYNIKTISDINLTNVSLKYGNNFALKKINLKLETSNFYGLVGESGSGKSSLLDILSLSNFEFSGNYNVNNKNLYKYFKDQLKNKIGYLFQDPIMTNDNLINNLNFYSPSSTKAEISKAVKLSAADFIYDNKLKFNSSLGEGGSKLSGGEKQRIALSRILLMNSDFLLFDEITSAIDAYNENIIIKNLKKNKEKKIIIMATHNLSLLKSFDKIIYMDKGTILNIAPHNELLRQSKSYKNLFDNSSTDTINK